MKIGYARVSTSDQRFDRQLKLLKEHGVERVYQDVGSGGKRNRVEINKMLDQLRKDDLVVVATLDRLSRSLRDMLEIVETIRKCGANFLSINEKIDSSSPSGRLMFHVFGVIAEFERERIRERVREGISAARAKGRVVLRVFTVGLERSNNFVHRIL